MNAENVVAALTALSLIFLGLQVFQANRLQRNKVEEEYLRRALENIRAGTSAFYSLASTLDDMRRLGTIPAGERAPFSAEIAASFRRFGEELVGFAARIQETITFAEAVERVHGTGEYSAVKRALQDANAKTFALRDVAGKAIRGELTATALGKHEAYVDALLACDAAAAALAERIVRMYRLADMEP